MLPNPNLLIDTSYCIYHTAFSTYNWYKYEIDSNVEKNSDFDPSLDKEFIAEFENRFLYNIFKSVRQIYPLFDSSKMIFTLDCARKNIWRMSYFPEYKISRKDIKRVFSISGLFNYCNNIMIPNICEKYHCKSIKIDGAEGDDIIAILILKIFNEDENIVIASDKDLNQLLDKCIIVTLNGEIREKQSDPNFNKNFILKKTLIGDNGDEIPSVFPRCGEKTAEKLINNIEELNKKLNENISYKEAFKRNLRLIDFKYIPKEIEFKILEEFGKL